MLALVILFSFISGIFFDIHANYFEKYIDTKDKLNYKKSCKYFIFSFIVLAMSVSISTKL